MKIRFIGTGSGKTSLKRDHSSILIENGNSNLLIDCGDGISKAFLKNSISFNSINSILFTHYHADHFSGITSLITQMKLIERVSRLTIFTHTNLVEPLKNFLHSTYIFEESLQFELDIIGFEFGKDYSINDEISFYAKQNLHITNKYRTDSIPENQFVSSSMLIKIKDESIIYTSDIGIREDLFLFDEVKPKIFITETTHIDKDWIHGIVAYYHPEQIYLTHISDEDEQELVKYLRNQTFPHSVKVMLAEDGHSVTLF